MEDDDEHGSYAAFQRCRKRPGGACEPCRVARNAYYADYRARRAAAGGERLGYSNTGRRRRKKVAVVAEAKPKRPTNMSLYFTGLSHEGAGLTALTAKEWRRIHGYNPETRTYERTA